MRLFTPSFAKPPLHSNRSKNGPLKLLQILASLFLVLNNAYGLAVTPAPPQVTGLSASQGTLYGKVALSWSASTDATQYDLFRSTTHGPQGPLVASNLAGTSTDDIGITDGTHYFYTVVAKNSSGSAPGSVQAEGWGKLPGTVTTLDATQGTVENAVQLSWAAVPDATSYKIYRASASGGALDLLATATTNSYTDLTAGYGIAYYYKAVASVGFLRGLTGNEAAGWGKVPAPSKVVGLSATQGTLYGKMTVSWTAATNATQYDLYRSGSLGTKGSLQITNVTGTSYSLSACP